jgi:hypothetical protein
LKNQISKRGDNLNFNASVSKIRVSGDCKYKNFGLEDLLIPEKLDFDLKWLKGNQTVKKYSFKNVKINSEEIEILNKSILDTIHASSYSMSVENMIFSFTGNNINKLNEKVSQIDVYFSQSEIVDKKLAELNNINADPDAMRRNPDLDKINNIKRIAEYDLELVRNLKNQNFYKNLVQKGEDPDQISKKADQIEDKSHNLIHICEDIFNHLDEIYYNRAMEMLSHNNVAGAEQFLNKSIQQNSNFAPSHFQLAKIFYIEGNSQAAINKIFEIRQMNPDPQTKSQTIEFANGIYKDFLLQASDLNSRGQFDKAIAVLSDAKHLCTDFPEVQCLSNMDSEYSQAVNGKYDIILHNFDGAFAANKLGDAEQFIVAAENYRQNNLQILSDGGDITEKINKLYTKYLNTAQNENKQMLYEKALTHLSEAQRICNNYHEISCTPELSNEFMTANTGIYNQKLSDADKKFHAGNYEAAENSLNDAASYRSKSSINQDKRENDLLIGIKQKIHDKLISDAQKLEIGKNFETALQKYKDARTMESQFSIISNKSIEKYITGAAKSLILQKLSEGETLVNSNNLTGARGSYNQAQLLQSEYSLSTDRDIIKVVNALKDKIFKQECLNAQSDYDKIFAKSLSFETVKDYISEDNTLNEALKQSSNFPYCGLMTKPALDKKHEIEDAVTYSKKINTLFDCVKNSDYQTSINLYIDATEFYKSQNISRYNIQHDDLYTFILKQNSNFVNFACGWYIDNKDYDKAVELFKVLKSRNYDRSYTENNQIKFASAAASKDFSENPSSDYKANIIKYFGEDNFFKYFTKAYKKQWKRLK